MNIKELKKVIENLPDTMDIFMAERQTEYAFALVNSAKVKNMLFYDTEDPDNEEIQATDDVLILDEE